MILLLGSSGYVGQAFTRALQRRAIPFQGVSRQQVDYTHFDSLVELLRATRADFVINAAGYTGKPNVEACERARAETLLGNTALPLTISHACSLAEIPWGHTSSGCIYSGAVVEQAGLWRVEPDLTTPEMQNLVRDCPSAIRGFREDDEPNFTFRRPPCSFYSGTKALAEELLATEPRVYLWRLRMPFNELDGDRNYLSKLQRYAKIYDNVNSLSHLDDFVQACLDLWQRRAPFGIYNVTNPGFVTTRQVVELIRQYRQPQRDFEYWLNDQEFYQHAATTPRANCVLDTSKLQSAGVVIRSVQEALVAALARSSDV